MYVSGLLSIEEMRDVEMKACQFPAIKTHLESLQVALEHFAMSHAMPPRPELKTRILKAIQDEATKNNGMKQATINREATVRALPSSSSNYLRVLAAASIIVLAVVSGIAYYLSSQYNTAKTQLAEQQDRFQKQLDGMQQKMNESTDRMHLLTDENTIRVTMKGTDKSPSSMALIYWNKQSKAVYLDVKSLPPVPSDKQYQLWFIDPKKGPVSAGVFDMKTGEMIRMTDAPNAAAFAVTMEPYGGSVSPSLDQMYVLGNINS